jgi:hypothetical protein
VAAAAEADELADDVDELEPQAARPMMVTAAARASAGSRRVRV